MSENAEPIRLIKSSILSEQEKGSLDGAAVFDPDSLDAAIIGVTLTEAGDAVAVYSYDALVACFQALLTNAVDSSGHCGEPDEEQASDLDRAAAMDWVEFNTLPSIPYMGRRAPVVVDEVEVDDYTDPVDVGQTRTLYIAGRRFQLR